MKIISDMHDKKCIILVECSIEEFSDVNSTLGDIQQEYAGYKSKRQKNKQLMEDMENQIAELLGDRDLE